MEGANRGPYARLIRLSNGRYKRVVDPVVPEIFNKFLGCCNSDISGEQFDFLTKGTYEPYSENKEINEKEYYSEGVEKLYSEGFNGIHTHSDREDYPTKPLKTNIHNGYTSKFSEEYQSSEDYDLNEMEEDKESMVIRGGSGDSNYYSKAEYEQRRYISITDETHDEGIPVLFYTKTREKPTLLMMVVDHDRQVIFMKRNKTTRFFPIKLINKLVTSTQKIQEVFSKQIKNDPTVRISNMVLFNAANFTEEVALQFASGEAKDQFIKEVNYIKDLIKSKL